MSGLMLVIANKAYSSWSLRPWLALKQADAAFTEVVIPLRQPETRASRHSVGRAIALTPNGLTLVSRVR